MKGQDQHGVHLALDGRELDERVRAIFRQAPGAMWSVDRDLKVTHVVGQLAFSTTFDEEKIIGSTVEEIIGTEDPDNAALASHRAAVSGRSASFHYDFHNRIYAIHLEPIHNRDGNIEGACGVAIDATKRIRAIRDLRRSVSLLRATLDATEDGVLVVDRQRRISAFNKRFLDLWNIPEKLATRGNDRELLDFVEDQLQDPNGFIRGVRELYDEPATTRFDRVELRSGRVFTRYSGPQMLGDEVVGRVWSFRDVTEREHMLKCALFLAEASQLLSSLDAEQALPAVARLAVPGFGDACAIDLFGGEGEPRRLTEIAPEGTSVPDLPQSVFAGRSLICRAGRRSHLSVPMRSHGDIVGAITLVTSRPDLYDESVVKTTEDLAGRAALAIENARIYRQAKEALTARDDLLSVTAHEIRGPATSIHLAAQNLRKRHPEDDTQNRLLEIVEREGRRLAGFVDDLIDVGRIRSGVFRVDLAEVDLVDVIHQVALRLGPELTRAGSKLSLATDASVIGLWDRGRLDQIVSNLLTNALRFGRGQPIDVSASANGDRAKLVVRDRGIGIKPEMQERIFSRYERGSVGRHYGGLGLGLFIVRTIVDALGGEIHVDSEPGQGATFTVELPQKPAPESGSRK